MLVPTGSMALALGAGLIGASSLLYWSLLPRRGLESRFAAFPGMWIVLPLLIIFGLLSGGSLIYASIPR